MNRTRLNQTALALLACLPLLASAAGNDISKVNGTIQVDAGQQAGDIETVNGTIRIESGASIEDASTVNGSITLGDRVTAAKLDTVNGTIRLGEGVKARSLETVNGSLRVGAGSRVDDGILVEKPTFSVFRWKRKVPKIVVGPHATVQGTLQFEHEVQLYVSDTAKVGRIEGATPIRFSGDGPGGADLAKQQVER